MKGENCQQQPPRQQESSPCNDFFFAFGFLHQKGVQTGQHVTQDQGVSSMSSLPILSAPLSEVVQNLGAGTYVAVVAYCKTPLNRINTIDPRNPKTTRPKSHISQPRIWRMSA